MGRHLPAGRCLCQGPAHHAVSAQSEKVGNGAIGGDAATGDLPGQGVEQVVIGGSDNEFGSLIVDFFVPDSRIAFEFHGIQHDEFNKFFHGDKSNLEKQKKRDSTKKEWCQLNNITLIEVRDPYCSTEELKQLITDSNAKS